ncbi:MAG: histidine kinase dimerization/phospho-acceptor domain-containing protein [Vicinamibacterales bacterium]
MQPNMAQVLNTLAHEIRTPLAVSQGYLKLYVDGRLPTPDDQQRALKQTREALGVIAVLCADISKVSALAEAASPALAEQLDTAALAQQLSAAPELAGTEWLGEPPSPARIATNAPKDLVRAMVVMIRSALDEDKAGAPVVEWTNDHGALVVRAGTADAVRALPPAPDAAGAAAVNVERGGKGLTLIWAAFVLDRHGIQVWNHQDYKASVAFRISLVTV